MQARESVHDDVAEPALLTGHALAADDLGAAGLDQALTHGLLADADEPLDRAFTRAAAFLGRQESKQESLHDTRRQRGVRRRVLGENVRERGCGGDAQV